MSLPVSAIAALAVAAVLLILLVRIVRWRLILPLLALAIAVTTFGVDITPVLNHIEQITINLFGGPQ